MTWFIDNFKDAGTGNLFRVQNRFLKYTITTEELKCITST